MKLSGHARAQVAALHRHYFDRGRIEASAKLVAAIRQASRQINAGNSIPAPRPYPELATPGHAWTHAGRYWVAHTLTKPFTIVSVFYDEADIPGRF